MPDERSGHKGEAPDPRRIVVVGTCASGKTTLVDRLQALGLDAHVSGQEHSAVRDLWRRLAPDVLVVLDVDLATVRARRSPTWPAQIFAAQQERLRGAVAAADLIIDTARHDADEVVRIVTSWLATHRQELSSG